MFYARIAVASVLLCTAPMLHAGERSFIGFDVLHAAMPYTTYSSIDYTEVAATPTPIIRTLPQRAETETNIRPIITPRPRQQTPASEGGYIRGYLESLDR